MARVTAPRNGKRPLTAHCGTPSKRAVRDLHCDASAMPRIRPSLKRVAFLENRDGLPPVHPKHFRYNRVMQRKVFWMTFTALGLIADLALPFWWALGATIPVGMLAWWIAYRSDWF
jgi:hypothetical protein